MRTTAMYSQVVLGLTLTTLAPAILLGQRPDASAPSAQPTIQTQVSMMKVSSRLRLRASSTRHEGRLVFRNADSLGIRGPGGESHLALPAVDSLWVRKHHTGEGFLIGSLVGVAAYIVTTSVSTEDSDMSGVDNAFGGIFWAGSTVLGTIVGAIIPKWKRVYP